MSAPGHWSDLAPRVLSGAAMAGVGAVLVWQGGWLFTLAAALLGGAMIWEGARMFGAPNPVGLGILGTVAIVLAAVLPWYFVVPVLVGASVAGAGQATRDHPLFLAMFIWVMLATFALILLRQEAGVIWLIWLVLVVVVSDVAGYFAGRSFGGPKFWPSISPKKTWSGTLAGWAGAAVVGALFVMPTGAGMVLVPVSMLVCFGGQMGDIAESAVKRRVGVKDSSNLIPGHGGVLDRFDAMMGAGVATILLWAFNVISVVS